MKTLFDLLHQAHQIADAAYVNETAAEGLTPRQLMALRVIENNPGCSQTFIVSETGIDRSTLADIMRRLKASGHLRRHRTKEDARTYAVVATDAGLKAVQAAENARKRAEAAVTNKLTKAQMKTLTDALAAMIESQHKNIELVAAE